MNYELTSLDHIYSQAVAAIKSIKTSNQRIAQPQASPPAEHQLCLQAKLKIDQWINLMDKNYLQPESARRVQIMKQQIETEWSRHLRHLNQYEEQLKRQTTNDEETNNFDEDMQGMDLDFEHENYLMKEKTKQLREAHSKLENINGVVLETQKLAYEQGQNLDLIDGNMSGSLGNVQQSNSYLTEANEEQKKGQSKYLCLLVGAVGAAVVVLGGLYYLA